MRSTRGLSGLAAMALVAAAGMSAASEAFTGAVRPSVPPPPGLDASAPFSAGGGSSSNNKRARGAGMAAVRLARKKRNKARNRRAHRG